jgi:hypothetical protein
MGKKRTPVAAVSSGGRYCSSIHIRADSESPDDIGKLPMSLTGITVAG